MVLKIDYKEILEVFRDKLRIDDRVRSLASRYKYREYMIARYIDMLGFDETIDLLEIFEKRDLFKNAIACNNLRCRCRDVVDSLENMGFSLRPIEWAEYSYVVVKKPSRPSLGATHEYLKGCYYQYRDAASLAPVVIFDPSPGSTILDSCAAPGGKTSYMLIRMKDNGLVIANDISATRLRALKYNMIRMGFKNYIITRFDARRTHEFFREELTRIFIDAPCSAEGAIMFDPERKTKTDYEVLARLVSREIEILSSSIEALAPGGVVAYVTCSIAPEENEYVVSKVLEFYKDQVDTVSPLRNIWSRGIRVFLNYEFDPGVENCVRIWPHKHFMEGFFVCLLKRR